MTDTRYPISITIPQVWGTKGFGGVPHIYKVAQRMVDQQGVWEIAS